MSEHAAISTRLDVREQDEKSEIRAEFPSPDTSPREWLLDGFGCPTWISSAPHASTAPWTPLGAPPYGRLATWSAGQLKALAKVGGVWMPSLPRHAPTQHGYGAPRLRETARAVVLHAAWMRDLRAASYGAIAHELEFDATRGCDAATKMARRYVREGRRLLCDEGVLPWRAWPAGELPPHWWQRQELDQQLRRWHAVGRDVHREIARSWVYCTERVLQGDTGIADPGEFMVPPWRLVGALQSRARKPESGEARSVYPCREDSFIRLLRILQARVLYKPVRFD